MVVLIEERLGDLLYYLYKGIEWYKGFYGDFLRIYKGVLRKC